MNLLGIEKWLYRKTPPTKYPEIDIEGGDSPADCMAKMARGKLIKQAGDPLRRDQLQSQVFLAIDKASAMRSDPDLYEAWWRVARTIARVLAGGKLLAKVKGWQPPHTEVKE